MYYLIIVTLIQIYYLFYILEPNKSIKLTTILLLLIIAFIKTPFYSLVGDLFYLFFIAWTVVALMGYLIKPDNLRKIIEISFFIELITALSYYLAGGILMFFETSSFEEIYNYNVIVEENSIAIAILSGVIFIIFILLSKIAKIHDILINVDFSINGMVIILGLNLSFKIMYEIQNYSGLIYIGFVIINLLVLLMYMANKSLDYNKKRKEKEVLEKELIINELNGYIETIEDLSNQINDLKHDCKNIIIGTSPEKIQSMVSNIENTLNKSTLYTVFIDMKSIKNNTIKSLLYYYIVSAVKKDIYVKIKVIGEIDQVNISSEHISRIIGILFDNAIESSSKSIDKTIEIYIENSGDNIDFTISNSILDSNIDLTNIFQRGYTTKGKNRGIGLSILNKIIDTYDNVDIYTNIYDKVFVQELFVKNNI